MLVYYCVDVSIIIFVMLGSMPTGFALVVKTETLPGVPNRHVGIGNPANGVVILMPEKKEKEKKSNYGNAWLKNLLDMLLFTGTVITNPPTPTPPNHLHMCLHTYTDMHTSVCFLHKNRKTWI